MEMKPRAELSLGRQDPKKEHSASQRFLPRMISDSSVPNHSEQRPGFEQGCGSLSPSPVPEIGLGGDVDGQNWGESRGKCPHLGRRRCLLPTRILASLLAALLSPQGLCPPHLHGLIYLFFLRLNIYSGNAELDEMQLCLVELAAGTQDGGK